MPRLHALAAWHQQARAGCAAHPPRCLPRALIGSTHVRAERADARVAAAARRVAKDEAKNEISARAAHIHRIAGDESQPLLEHYEAIN